jgi:uncharacterized repeat protein (TIGR03803 family)
MKPWSIICGLGIAALSLISLKPAKAQATYNSLFSFTQPVGSYSFYSLNTSVGLTAGSDGSLYGVSPVGGANGKGCIFTVKGSGMTDLFDFGGQNSTGVQPAASLVQAPNGTLFGATLSGGTGSGVIFRMNPDGTGYQEIHVFNVSPSPYPFADGAGPYAPPTIGPDGALYGTTYAGGSVSAGTVYRMEPDGSSYSILYNFQGGTTDGAQPDCALAVGNDGTLYGATQYGGVPTSAYAEGTVFAINPDGSNYRIVHSFLGYDAAGFQPVAVIQGQDGALYGESTYFWDQTYGTNFLFGVVWRLDTSGGDIEALHTFGLETGDGFVIAPGLVQATDGTLYGITAYTYEPNGADSSDTGAVFAMQPDGGGYSILHDFGSTSGDGFDPGCPPVIGADGALYGATNLGSTNGYGNVFRISGPGLQILSGVIQVPTVYGAPGSTIPVTGMFQASDGSTPSGLTIDFQLDGSDLGTATTNANGVATLMASLPAKLSKAKHTLTASFAGNHSYAPAAGTGILNYASYAGTLTLSLSGTVGTQAKPLYVDGSNAAKVVATLKGGSKGKTAIAGVPVTFMVGSQTFSATTASNGEATILYSAPAGSAPGQVRAAASFGGSSSTGTAVSSPLVLNIAKVPTKLVVSAVKGTHGKAATIAAELKLASGAGLGSQPIVFTLGSQTFNATTAASGTAKASIVLPSTAGTYTLTATYAGTAIDAPASGSATVTVK